MKAHKSEPGKKLLNDQVFCDNLRKIGTKENAVVVDSSGKKYKIVTWKPRSCCG